MTDEQMKELAELRVAIQDLKYQLIQKHKSQAEIEALHKLIKEQDMKIINLSFDLAYANRTDEFAKLRELTDEEILEVWRENERVYPMDRSRLLDRTRACIKKASEK